MDIILAQITLENIVICGIPMLIVLIAWAIKVLRRIALAQEITAKLAIYKFKEEEGGGQYGSESYVAMANAMNINLGQHKE